MLKDEYKVYEEKMRKSIDSVAADFAAVRAGRANAAVLDRISVDYYGTPTPIQQIASIGSPDPRQLLIQPWDASAVKLIEKAILNSDLGINPQNDGKAIRLTFPQLTEERRKELTKQVKKYGEDAKVAVRNVRRDAVDFVPNYDNTMKEPTLLPTTFPNVLVSANTGIAVGMASNICSFNLAELCATTVALMKDEHHDISTTMPAPDFVGGGQILYDEAQMRDIFENGRGSVKVRARYAAVPGENMIEVTQIPPTTTVEAIMDKIAELVKAGKVRVDVAQVPQKLYIEVIAKGGGHTGRAIVRDLHTNVVLVEQDGVATLDKRDTDTAAAGDSDVVTPEQIASFLTVRSIWDYCTKELDPMNDPIDIIRSAVKVNSVISDEGLSKEYGLAIGRNLDLNCRKGLMTRDLTTNSMIAAAAGADARMAGAPVSVVANSGSGNQGITATMPVVAAAHWLDIDEPTMLRAVTLSNLIAIRIKSKFGRLSNLCGATVAGTGAACGITYLLGGGYHEICCAIQNMVGNVTGMVCDGAKADCALKISTCVNAACQAAAMGTRGVRVQSTDGIVEENVERTLDNFAILSTHGTSDSVILDLMLNKEHAPDAE